jgi:tetratricopeptide (TPR) repeat protein
MLRHSNRLSLLTLLLLITSLALATQHQVPNGTPSGTKQASREVKTAFDAGLKLSAEGKFEAAIAEYRKALAIDPEQPYILANLADALAKVGKDNEALAAYDKAAQLKPGDAAFITNCGVLLGKMGKGAESLEMFKKAAAINPSGAARNFYNLGATLVNQGECEQAMRAFREASAADPSHGKLPPPPCKDSPVFKQKSR